MGDFGQTAVTQFTINLDGERLRFVHNTGDDVRYSFRQVSGFFNVPYNLVTNKGSYTRKIESPTICWCNYKGSTFPSAIIKTLSLGPALGSNPDFPHESPKLNYLSHRPAVI